ncbi:hypothetical protein [Streptomyces sp. NPDC029674]|uniref:hypothetical protein n=1 Tax=Streptomyces sp. NPDC029674 TaxID=3365297 RepID=UPI00384A7FFB
MQFIPAQLVPMGVGAIGPQVQGPALAVVLLCALCLLAARFLPRGGRAPVLEELPPPGARQGRPERLHSEARADSPWEDDGPLATGQAREEAARAEAEAELRRQISEWASEAAGRMADAPQTAPHTDPWSDSRADPWSDPWTDPTGSGR